jgi:hypothetical protein
MPSFATDIRPLFRDRDVDSMTFAFDLTDYDEVREHADRIYQRVQAGEMPCDSPWTPDRVALFRRWMDEGYAQ